MAPSRKLGTSRISAALDAMKEKGFPRNQVRSMMNKLLRVYGGVDGYPFIEDNAYMVLIDALLEEEEEKKHREALIQGDSSAGQTVGDNTAGPSNGNVVSSNSHPVDTHLQTELAEGDGSQAVEATDEPAVEGHFRDVSGLDLLASCASSFQASSSGRRRPCLPDAQLRRSKRKTRWDGRPKDM